MTGLVIEADRMPSARSIYFAEEMRDLDSSLVSPEADFRASLLDTTKQSGYRFAALYGLLHRLRREERFNDYTLTVKQYEREFGAEGYFETFRVVVSRGHGADARSLRQALEHSERAILRLPEVAGILHQYAELVATMCDVTVTVPADVLERAIERSTRAIQLAGDIRPHYHATRARLYLEAGKTDQSRTDIGVAIEGEDSSSRDFARRISKYESVRLLIAINERQHDIRRLGTELRSEVAGFRRKQLQLLAMLAAVMAFLSAAAGIATRATLADGLRLIVASGGVTSVAFSSLAIAFGGSRPARLLLAIGIGTLLIIIAIAYPG